MRRPDVFQLHAKVLSNTSHGADWHTLELQVPAIADRARPGHFVQLQCHPLLPMRRPMSIMRAGQGRIEILYRATGRGTRLLADIHTNGQLEVLGPLGRPYQLQDYRRHPLLIGGGVGIPPLIFLAGHMRKHTRTQQVQPLVLMGARRHLPFTPRASIRMVDGLPPGVTACIPLLEDWGISSRLAMDDDRPGCYTGPVTDLAEVWLQSLDPTALHQVELYGCGPRAMLQTIAALAHKYAIPAQVSIEEYTPCGVGGCGACAVPVVEQGVTRMLRVCVDGPVFAAESVFPRT